jgi:hypothetical protein
MLKVSQIVNKAVPNTEPSVDLLVAPPLQQHPQPNKE